MPNFQTLWKNYPDPRNMKKKCVNDQGNSQKPFSDYCAINMSECFIRSGILVNSASGTKCWSHSGAKHLLLAQDFASWINISPPPGFGKRKVVKPADFQKELKGRTGVVFFKDYWRRGGENHANRSGDHIDLWNKSKITSSPMWWRSVIEYFNVVSDLNASKSIWFWEVK